jgi:2-oxoglutarate dehydrogenase E2 component (dihydrolipoamide succinyltransferase)
VPAEPVPAFDPDTVPAPIQDDPMAPTDAMLVATDTAPPESAAAFDLDPHPDPMEPMPLAIEAAPPEPAPAPPAPAPTPTVRTPPATPSERAAVFAAAFGKKPAAATLASPDPEPAPDGSSNISAGPSSK